MRGPKLEVRIDSGCLSPQAQVSVETMHTRDADIHAKCTTLLQRHSAMGNGLQNFEARHTFGWPADRRNYNWHTIYEGHPCYDPRKVRDGWLQHMHGHMIVVSWRRMHYAAATATHSYTCAFAHLCLWAAVRGATDPTA